MPTNKLTFASIFWEIVHENTSQQDLIKPSLPMIFVFIKYAEKSMILIRKRCYAKKNENPRINISMKVKKNLNNV